MGFEATEPTVQDCVRFGGVRECSYRKVAISPRRRSVAVSIVAVSIVVSTYVVVESRQQCREHKIAEHRAKLPLHKAANQLRADQITCKNKYMHVQAYGVRVVFLEHGNLSWHLLASRRLAPKMLDHLPYYIVHLSFHGILLCGRE